VKFSPPNSVISRLCLVCAVCGVAAAACGRKGPPLAPIVYVPRAVSELSAKRTENEVVLRFTLPTVNTDNTGPANLRRIEVYAHTGPLPATADYLKFGTLIASIDVKDPETVKSEQAAAAASAEKTEADAEPVASPVAEAAVEEDAPDAAAPQDIAPTPPPSAPSMLEQGWTTTVRETLTEKHKEIGPMPPARPAPAAPVAAKVETLETPGTVNFELPLARYYTVVGLSRNRGRRGPFAGPVRVPLVDPSNAPEKVDVDYTADAIVLAWPPLPEDITPVASAPPAPIAEGIGRLETEGTANVYTDVETPGTQNPPPLPLTTKAPPTPTARFGYNVYEFNGSSSPADSSLPTDGLKDEGADRKPDLARVSPPVPPLNTALVTTSSFKDPRVEFGTERCYVVRRVEMAGAIAIESAPSVPVCVTPVDTFPPAPPKNLAHIASGSGVSLLWEANSEPDLGGYVVLRGEAPGDKLAPLTPAPITNTSFTDTTVRRGRTYVYEVVALDKATPANQSAPSNRVEETIR
jgi:hypothetical protein